ncbi:MAG: hypothetical protein NT086_01630 [Proteobacteria bacterium]|nr:hypothetical protein [Pseudomonadota bacterium]
MREGLQEVDDKRAGVFSQDAIKCLALQQVHPKLGATPALAILAQKPLVALPVSRGHA